jgi:uncharacterized membrane protein YfcA
MRRLLFCCVVGSAIGYTVGRFAQLLPPVWSVIVAGVFATGIWFWAFHSLREIEQRSRALDDILKRNESMRELRHK